MDAIRNASRRLDYSQKHGEQDGRTIGDENELTLMAAFAADSAAQGRAKTRTELTSYLGQLLEIRQAKLPQSLTTSEKAFLKKPAHQRTLHDYFWHRYNIHQGL